MYYITKEVHSRDSTRPFPRLAVIIPCYKVRKHVLDVIGRIPKIVDKIYCIDDCCPEQSGKFIEEAASDPRVKIIFRQMNGGVGAAVRDGYRAALLDGYDICVKVDGDGQMAPESIPSLILPIAEGMADYTKGNRFFNIEDLLGMPLGRLIGNAGLSFFAKLSTGYWDIFDPTNGFTAIHSKVLERINLDKVAPRYFFETDLLFRLACLNARVIDIPMAAHYADEISNLRVSQAIPYFFWGNSRNYIKRLFYMYFLRDFSLGSLYLIAATILTLLGGILGVLFWARGVEHGYAATPGQVMFSALPLVFALQLTLSFLGYDIARTPRVALHPLMSSKEYEQ